ncbi:AHH domain-containing protein [Streptomyces sp. CB03238]|uniref:AHH domain-containing protein n=1 Tax=Streptomyces sp. CB03238 TaxID=1907777 RepID=UPI001F4E026D|nr:AHH domain-containing protein [Streptomyces sp. CB03238]
MTHEGRAPSPGQAAAHLVPSGGSRRLWAPGARSRALLERYRVSINDAANGVGLTYPKPHNYTHRGAFLQ